MKKQNRIILFLFLFLISVLSVLAADIKEKKEMDKANLHNLYSLFYMYSQDFKGFCPPDLWTLCEVGYVPGGSFYVSSNSNTKTPKSREDMQKGACDYLYFGKGVNLQTLKKDKKVIPLMSTKAGIYPEAYVILYSNGLATESSSLPNIDDIIKVINESEDKSSEKDKIPELQQPVPLPTLDDSVK